MAATTQQFNGGEAYRKGRRTARHIVATEGPLRLRELVEQGNAAEAAGTLTRQALHEHWGTRSILREEHPDAFQQHPSPLSGQAATVAP